MSLLELKLIFSALVFAGGVIGVVLPWAIAGRTAGERFVAWGDSFAAGVLTAAGLVHLLSSGATAFHTLDPGSKFPVAFVLAGAGFLLTLLFEAVILADPDPSCPALRSASERSSHDQQHLTTDRGPVVFVLLCVLSIHSVIVGITLGVQSSPSNALIVLIAILAHKSVAGFALGVSYCRAGCSLRGTARIAAVFSIMAPLGILAGTTIETLVSFGWRQLFEAIFDSVGAGTFLYIATLDIIRTEFEMPGDRWQKSLFTCAGFSIMAVLALWL